MPTMRIKQLRKEKNLTLAAVATHVGVTTAAVIFWEQSKGFPTADKLPNLATLFGCTIDGLYGPDPPAVETAS